MLLNDLPDCLRLKARGKEIYLYAPEEVEYDNESYIMAQGYYFPTKKRGIKKGETFKHASKILTSVVDLPNIDVLVCKGLPDMQPEGALPAFKIS